MENQNKSVVYIYSSWTILNLNIILPFYLLLFLLFWFSSSYYKFVTLFHYIHIFLYKKVHTLSLSLSIFFFHFLLDLLLIGKQEDNPISCSSKDSFRANIAVWTKNRPKKGQYMGTPLKSVKVVHTNRPCSSSMYDLQMSMDEQNLLRPDRRIHNT